ncbi:MAG: hypothetical protein HUU38_15515 [Anaerolineales bacterium]|nr:hypothetical protein [Anaerolineales bacterium]
MPYQFVPEKADYTDFASGRVFYNAPGHPAFPVRLVDEMFQRALALRRANGQTGPVTLYDPCCGAAYHLAVLGYLHGPALATIIASDVDGEILNVARRNLALLTPTGLAQRLNELETLAAQFGKESHRAALETVARFQHILQDQKPIPTHLFQADATQPAEITPHLPTHPVDLVLTDVPYDQHTTWHLPAALRASSQSPVWHLLDALQPTLSRHTLLALAADKGQKIAHEAYQRLARFQIGKRHMVFLRLHL